MADKSASLPPLLVKTTAWTAAGAMPVPILFCEITTLQVKLHARL